MPPLSVTTRGLSYRRRDFAFIGGISLLSHYYTLNGIKSRTVGDGQHGTARFATTVRRPAAMGRTHFSMMRRRGCWHP